MITKFSFPGSSLLMVFLEASISQVFLYLFLVYLRGPGCPDYRVRIFLFLCIVYFVYFTNYFCVVTDYEFCSCINRVFSKYRVLCMLKYLLVDMIKIN